MAGDRPSTLNFLVIFPLISSIMIPISVQYSQFNLINDFSTNSQINIDSNTKLSDVVENNVSNQLSRNHSESTLAEPKQDQAGYDIDLFTNSISSDMLTDALEVIVFQIL